MSSNFIKAGNVIREEEVRVINSNDLVSQKLERLAELLKEDAVDDFTDAFLEGIDAQQVEVLLGEDDGMKSAESGSPIQNRTGSAKDKNQEEEARLQRMKAEATAEAENILAKARADAEVILAKAKEEGYLCGRTEALHEIEEKERELNERMRLMEEDFRRKSDELEPKFVDVITGIYEHIFEVQLDEYRGLVVHLINQAMGNIEAGKNYLIHVSKDDYAYVSMKKKELLQGTGVGSDMIEIIEDFSLAKGHCMIETNGGIFDCGLGTQMERLNKELRLLSYGND